MHPDRPITRTLTVTLVVTLVAAISLPVNAAEFSGLRALAVSYRPAAADLVDLDADNDLDLVVVCTGEFASNQWNGSVVHVFLNPGDGVFASADDYSVPDAPYGLAVADLNNDDSPDLVTPNAAPDNLQVLLNDGSGHFLDGDVVPVGTDPVAVVAADFDGDDDLDLASADQFGFGVSVAFNGGDASFDVVDFYSLGDLINGVQAGDVDNDDDADLIAFGSGGALLLRNDGFGNFGSAEPLGLGTVGAHTELALFDADAHLDLVGGSGVWLGNGDGTFDRNPIVSGLPDGYVRCFDFDGDGLKDVVTGAGVALADGGGGLQPPIDFDPPPDSGPIACGDFDGDEVADLVRLQAGIAGPIGFATLLPGNGDGSVAILARVPAGDSVWAVAADDVNGDGDADVLVANIGTPWGQFYDGSVSVLTGNGDGTVDPLVSYPSGDYVRTVRAGDLNGDEAPDMVTTNFNDATAPLFLNDGSGGFGPYDPLTVGDHPEAVAFADFDDDGNLDIAVTNYGLGATPASVSVLFGDGAGGIAASDTVSLTGHAALGISATDLNGDEVPDVAVACSGRYYAGSWTNFGLYVLLNNGDGTFGPEADYGTTYLPRTVNSCDVDSDNDPDLVVTTHGPIQSVLFVGEVLVFLNDGGGDFPTSVATPLTHDHFSSQCADFDGDGHADLAVPYLSAGVVTVLWGDGTGAFSGQSHYATGAEPRGVAVGEFNNDGPLDLAVAHSDINQLGILLSRPLSGDLDGDGDVDIDDFDLFADCISGPDVGFPPDCDLADLDGDGDVDLSDFAEFQSVFTGGGT
jgi:hypothetical protein